jgi:hypothetical protein
MLFNDGNHKSSSMGAIAYNGMRMSEVALKGAILASAVHPLIAEVTLR